MAKRKKKNSSVLARNRQAYRDHEILKEYEAGIVLTGGEVKSVVSRQVTLTGAYVGITRKQEAWLINAHIAQWPYDQSANYEPTQSRKLLLHKREINQLQLAKKQEGAVIVPLSLYKARGKIKVKIALAKPLRKYDKRRRDKERQEKRATRKLPKY